MGIIVFASYKPKIDKLGELNELIKIHVDILRAEGLATNRQTVLMKSKNGTIIEIFEWKSRESIEAAHTNKNVQNLWDKFTIVCDFVPISSLDETKELFTEFESIEC